jgi:prevent-host-death family protein
MARRVSTAEARARLSELIDAVAFGRERVLIERRGRPVAALVSIDDAKALEEGRPIADPLRGALALVGVWSDLSHDVRPRRDSTAFWNSGAATGLSGCLVLASGHGTRSVEAVVALVRRSLDAEVATEARPALFFLGGAMPSPVPPTPPAEIVDAPAEEDIAGGMVPPRIVTLERFRADPQVIPRTWLAA